MQVSTGYGLTDLSDSVSVNLAVSQARLQGDVSRLSSGLRIQSAADDPSGLAIAEGLQAKVDGYDQAAANVQSANNALTVADGALQTVTDLLQRLRSLAVRANDDLISAGDRSNLQTETTQLLEEVNSIAERTNFNGVQLLNRNPYVQGSLPSILDGTFASPSVAIQQFGITGSAWTFSPFAVATGGSGIATAADAPLSVQPPSGATQVGFVRNLGSIAQSVSGFGDAATYELTFNAATGSIPGETIGVLIDGKQIASYTPAVSAADWTAITTPAFVPGSGTHTIEIAGLTASAPGRIAYIDDVQLTLVSQFEKQAPDLQIQSGADEGNALGLQLPTVFTTNLGIASDSVSSTANAATFERNIDTALAAVDDARAALGAQMVALQFQATNDDTAAVNLTGSESNIRDLNVAQTATAYAADQILTSVGSSILGNIKTLAASVEQLFQ